MLGSIDGGTTIRGGVGDIAFLRNVEVNRRMSTPPLLRLGMVVTCLPVVAFAVAIHVGLARNDDTVQTVGEDATQGITVAQELKLNLAELDGIAVQELLAPPTLGAAGFPEAYNAKRIELQQNLVAAAGRSPGPAYGQTLVNINYVLGHYHALMADTFAAAAAQDAAAVVTNYDKAHGVMSSTLLPEADRFDKAHTYVLNDSYGRQKDRSLGTTSWIVGTWAVLIAILLATQLALAQRFHRIVSLPLVFATLLAVVALAGALGGLDRSADKLSLARDQAFDSIHKLARAREAAVAAQQAQGDFLLDPTDESADEAFEAQADRLFRVGDASSEAVAEMARSGVVDGDEAGYLGAVANANLTTVSNTTSFSFDAVAAFGDYVQVDQNMRQLVEDGDRAAAIAAVYGDDSAFHDLDDAISEAQDVGQRRFDGHADAAENGTWGLPFLNIGLAGGMVLLVVAGFTLRLREYSR